MASVEIEKRLCKGCALCVRACPKKVLEIGTESNNAGYFVAQVTGSACTGCAACAVMCPDVCITVQR